MPQVSDKFGPIYVNVTLDGSGNGQASFQAVGSNVRITNLFVKVATTTNQAVCRMYKNYVSDSTLISSTNSGSTGAAAHGAIDLFDGETVIARWTGGDAGAIATATFVGVKIPFGDRPTSEELTWDDPIAAGDGSLIYPALKSPNYVATVSGWRIAQDGTAEFNSVLLRGSLQVDGSGNSYIKILSSGGIPTFLIRSADQPGLSASEVYQAIIQNISWHPSGVNSSYQELSIQGPGWANGSTAADYDLPTILLTSPSHDGTQLGSVTIVGQGGPAALNNKLFNINLDGNVLIGGKFSRPNCLLSSSVVGMVSGTVANTLTHTAVRDTYSMFDGASTVTIPTGQDGTYELGMLGTYSAQAVAAGYRSIQIAKGGSTYRRMKLPTSASVNNEILGVNLIVEADLLAGDTITFLAHQNSGANLNFTGDCWVKQVENI